MSGKYIVLEGLDGSGKSTQHQLLCDFFGSKAIGVREPGGTPMAESIRTLIKDASLQRSPRTNMFLFSAARTELIDTLVRPHITAGTHVISDRNWLSTMAYQTAEGITNTDELLGLCRLATEEFFTPDLVLFIDTDLAICRKRLAGRGASAADYFDRKGDTYFEKVRRAYLHQLKDLPHTIVINGNEPVKTVAQNVLKAAAAILR